MSKPKEFWLDICTPDDGSCDFIHTRDPELAINPVIFATNIHVIEKSAYNDMQYNALKWMEDSMKYKAQADKLAEALEFIQSRTHSDPLLIEELNVRAARVYETATKALKDFRGEK